MRAHTHLALLRIHDRACAAGDTAHGAREVGLIQGLHARMREQALAARLLQGLAAGLLVGQHAADLHSKKRRGGAGTGWWCAAALQVGQHTAGVDKRKGEKGRKDREVCCWAPGWAACS